MSISHDVNCTTSNATAVNSLHHISEKRIFVTQL